MEELQAKQRQELRDLQSRVTQKEKSATKKTRKRVSDECATLEREMSQKHEAEIAQLNGGSGGDANAAAVADPDISLPDDDHTQAEDAMTSSLKAQQISTGDEDGDFDQLDQSPWVAPPQAKKQNRQKARLAKRTAEREQQAAQAAEEASYFPDLREKEVEAMQKQFKEHGLLEREIRPDGHCLYSAVASQLKDIGVGLSLAFNSTSLPGGDGAEGYQQVRIAAAGFMREHPDDFLPFLEVPFDDYVSKITDTAEWGGQLELQAIARGYGVDVYVLQANGRTEKIESGDGTARKQIWLAYYRHYFGLGEHYNALSNKKSISN